MFRLSNNLDLPAASALGVKSFWLMLVTVAITLLNAMGFDLARSFCEVGLGCTADQIATKGQHAASLIQQLLPILTAVWMWFERRAPQLRLVFWKKPATNTVLRLLALFAVLPLVTLSIGTAALAANTEPAALVGARSVADFLQTILWIWLAVSVAVSLLLWILLRSNSLIDQAGRGSQPSGTTGWRSE